MFAALLLTAVTTNAPAREFRAADTQSADYPTVQALRFMGRLIEEKTAGRLQIRVFHSRQLGEEKETIEQTRAGAIDLNRTNVALIGTFVPAMNVLAMPFLFRSIEHLQKVLDGPIGDEILGSFEPFGFVGLAFYDSGARSIYNSVRPVRTIADMKGLRLRVQQSELMSDMIRALGADGWFEVAQRGSHKQFRHPTKPGRVTVVWPSKDVPLGTLRSIEKQAGIKLR